MKKNQSKLANGEKIMSSIMNALEGFMSRLIENKERESYAHSLASRGQELVNPNENKRKWF